MKPIAPSQSKSPTSVPRLAEKSASIGLFMIGLIPALTMVGRFGSLVLVAWLEP